MAGEAPEVARSRDRSLDAFRGLSILAMAAGNLLAAKILTPSWLKHATDIGLTPADVIAPFFVVAMAASFRLTAHRRHPASASPIDRGSWKRAMVVPPDWRTSIAWRGLGLAGIGAVLSAGQGLVMPREGLVDWGVLQALGLSEFILLYVAGWPTIMRLLLAGSLLFIYQLLMPQLAPLTLTRVHGGLIGTVDWVALIVLADCALTRFSRARQQVMVGFLLAAGGGLLSSFLPLSKNRVSPDYVVVGLGLSLLAMGLVRGWFGLVHADARPEARDLMATLARPVQLLGAHPLGLYLGQELLLGFFQLTPWPWWGAEASFAMASMQLLLLFAALTVLALVLEWRRPALHPC